MRIYVKGKGSPTRYYMYVAHSNGEVSVWKVGQKIIFLIRVIQVCSIITLHLDSILKEPSESENFEESHLGMQLCIEGILSKRRLYHPSSDESPSISYESENFHLQLPPEVLSLPKPSVELDFAPFGPNFIFPDGMIPVSPAVWICFSPSTQFQEPAILKLYLTTLSARVLKIQLFKLSLLPETTLLL